MALFKTSDDPRKPIESNPFCNDEADIPLDDDSSENSSTNTVQPSEIEQEKDTLGENKKAYEF